MFFISFVRCLLLPAIAIVTLLPGCRKPTYTPQSFTHITPNPIYRKNQESLTLHLHPLSRQEAYNLFDGRGLRLLHKRKQIFPFYLSIENNSTRSFILDPKNITQKLMSPQVVAQKLHSHTKRRIVTTVILGTIGAAVTFFGAVYLIILGTIGAVAMPALIKAGYVSLGICGVFTLGTPLATYQQARHSVRVNKIIDADLSEKTLNSIITLQPGQTRTMLLFAHYKSYQSTFGLTLVDQETQKPLMFDIEIPKEGKRSCKR